MTLIAASNSPLLTPPEEAIAIVRRLRDNGHQALLCGGCVRDALLRRTPKDYDIATSAVPDQVQALFPKTVPIGKAFGVILVLGECGGQYEVATFRSDLGYVDGRRPEAVCFSTPEEDAKRRDFTMNALFYDPFTDQVIDYVGGREDIVRGVLRTVGTAEERFREDHLRLLRAIRFAARTGFVIEDGTWRAMCELAELVSSVSPERMASELEGMLECGNSRGAFDMLERSGLLAITLPELAATRGVEQPPDFHPEGDVWVHTLLLLELNDQTGRGCTEALDRSDLGDIDAARGMNVGEFGPEEYLAGVEACRAVMSDEDALTLAWSALLHDIGKPPTLTREDRIRFNNHDLLGAEMAVEVLERLRRPRKVADRVYDLIRRHIHFSTLRKMRKSKLRRWLQDGSFPLHLELHRLDCLASHAMLGNWWFGVGAWKEEMEREPEPEPLLRGGDIVAMGVKAGPEVGRLLRLVEDARLEGEIGSQKEALEFLKKVLAEER